MTNSPTPSKEYPVSVDKRNVTHRLIRSVKREETTRDHSVGVESVPTTTVVWEVSCACGDIFRKATDTEASAAYLNHLPKPTKTGA